MRRNQLDLEILSRNTAHDNEQYLDPFIELYNLNHDDGIFDSDSDLDELFADSEIEWVRSERLDGIVYDTTQDTGIILDEGLHYQTVGYDCVMQDGVQYKIPVLCMNNGCVLCDGYDLLHVHRI